MPASEELALPPQGAGLEEEDALDTDTASVSSPSSAAAASEPPLLINLCDEGDSEDEEHITLHQQPANKVTPQDDADDDDSISTYPIGLRTGEEVHSFSSHGHYFEYTVTDCLDYNIYFNINGRFI